MYETTFLFMCIISISRDLDFDKGNFFMIVFVYPMSFQLKYLISTLDQLKKYFTFISIKFTNASFMPMPLK